MSETTVKTTLEVEVIDNFQLKNYNSLRTKANARLFCAPKTEEELVEVLQAYPKEKKLVLGNGNNLFFTEDFDGLVIKPSMKGISIIEETDEDVLVEVSAGEDWDEFVAWSVERGFCGIENLSHIPGSVGAAPIQNIGAYGTEVKDVIATVNAVQLYNAAKKTFLNRHCVFTYRDSIFKKCKKFVITSVVFKLNKTFVYDPKYNDLVRELRNTPSPTLLQVREAIIRIRNRKLPDPAVLPNAGSFFKNPVLSLSEKDRIEWRYPEVPIYATTNDKYKTSAAYLIGEAEFRGKRIGNIGIYDKHSLIVVNYGTENGEEIVEFMREVRGAVYGRFGIWLEPEVQIY